MMRAGAVRTDIVLLGGGHAHVHVLKAFAMRPEPGVRLTLVTRDLKTPYSGMLPGVIAGLYSEAEAHIDLLRLAAVAGTRLIHAEAIGLDRARKRVQLAERPPIAYDLLSIDVGITPALAPIEGAAEHAIAVKPIGSFLAKFAALRASCRAADGPRRIAVIGGGAGGVELILSARTHLLSDQRAAGLPGDRLSFALVTDGEILPTHNAKVRASFRKALASRNIALHERSRARCVTRDGVILEGGHAVGADAVLVASGAAAPPWLRSTGLALDRDGFLAVGATLQALDDPDVFGAGDCVTLTAAPREKAGVFAVRAGPPLARNLRRRARGDSPGPWRPQRHHLALISTGERHAVASRGPFKVEGAWVWRWKDWIDRRWMRMYQDTDAMAARMPVVRPSDEELAEMRCGGCAAKVGPLPLSRALSRLGPPLSGGVLVGLDAPDDAAVLAPPQSGHLVQTVDFFRAFIDDPFVFGEIAANHALNDVFAMGATPRYALATAVVPPGHAEKVEEALFQMLAGARACLDREGVALAGGHSGEGADLALGFSVTGEAASDRILRKGGAQAGDALILTRPLGTGILFAAAMRGRADAVSVAGAIAEMRCSNRQAAEILRRRGATALTDVSGFGLIGHLGEMLTASGMAAELDLASMPLYDGVLDLAREGAHSTLLPANLALIGLTQGPIDDCAKAVLFDPQTSGGLLASVPASQASQAVAELRTAGCAQARTIGHVMEPERSAGAGTIRLIGTIPGRS